MNIFNRLLGNIINVAAKAISVILDIIIAAVEIIVNLALSLGRGLYGLLTMGGCLIFFVLGPFAIPLLFNPFIFLLIMVVVVIPILGTKFVSFLKYIKYVFTEYLFDRADNLIHGRRVKYEHFSDYGERYRRMEWERQRKEEERRRQEQQRQWEEQFRRWYEYQQSYQGGYQQGQGGYTGHSFVDPSIEFKHKYEESCDILGVSYNADKYQIKLAYRKKAKEYHPDLNKAPNATRIFQQINEAYEFLSDENIERYRNLN